MDEQTLEIQANENWNCLKSAIQDIFEMNVEHLSKCQLHEYAIQIRDNYYNYKNYKNYDVVFVFIIGNI